MFFFQAVGDYAGEVAVSLVHSFASSPFPFCRFRNRERSCGGRFVDLRSGIICS